MGLVVNMAHFIASILGGTITLCTVKRGKGGLPIITEGCHQLRDIRVLEVLRCEEICILESLKYSRFAMLSVLFICTRMFWGGFFFFPIRPRGKSEGLKFSDRASSLCNSDGF